MRRAAHGLATTAVVMDSQLAFTVLNCLGRGVSNEQLVPPTPRAPMRPEAHCATHASARLMASV